MRDFLSSSSGFEFSGAWPRRTKEPRLTRRTRRRIARVVGTPKSEDLLGLLCTWAAGMPWVVETRVAAQEKIRLFVVDCPVLARHAAWFAVETVPEGEFGLDHDIYLVLPQDLVRRGVEMGWAVGNEVVGTERAVTAVASPRSDEQFGALQRLLARTYGTAFGK